MSLRLRRGGVVGCLLAATLILAPATPHLATPTPLAATPLATDTTDAAVLPAGTPAKRRSTDKL